MKTRRETWDYISMWEKSGKVIPYFENLFHEQLTRILNMAVSIEDEDMDECPDNPDILQRTIYLGSILSLTPSGKFYLPFACSNVTVKEAAIDEIWQDFMRFHLEEEDLFLISGEGDGLDMFLVRYYDRNDYSCCPECGTYFLHREVQDADGYCPVCDYPISVSEDRDEEWEREDMDFDPPSHVE